MSATRVAFRATVYTRRSDDITEATILTPAAGAPHSDNFKIATVSGLSGYQPYMGMPTGARGAIDPLTRAWKTGQLTIPLLDKRTAETSELNRWVTAYLGDTKGRNQLLGCRVFVEISLDWDDVALSGSWSPFWVGRIDETALENPLFYRLVLDDFAKDLDVDCFAGRPHSGISYIAEPQLLPIGLSAAYGDFSAAGTMTGTINAPTVSRGTAGRLITLDDASLALDTNLITRALVRKVGYLPSGTNDPLAGTTNPGSGLGVLRVRRGLRLRCSCASPSFTAKECRPLMLFVQQRTDGKWAVKSILVQGLTKEDGSLATDDPYYQAFDTGTISNATSLTSISIRADTMPSAGTGEQFTEEAPLFIGDVAPMDFFRDLCDGDFSALYQSGNTIPSGKAAGDQVYPVAIDTSGSSNWDLLDNPTTDSNALPTMRFKITKRMKRFEALEKLLCQPLGIGYRLQPIASAVARIVPVDMRIPVAALIASIDTLTETDVSAEHPVTWETARGSAITEFEVRYYVDWQYTTTEISEMSGRFPDVTPSRIASVAEAVILPDYGRAIDLGQRVHVVDAIGIRGTTYTTDTIENIQSVPHATAQAAKVATHYQTFFGNAATYVGWKSHRTANTSDLWPGDWVYLDLNVLPDQGTNARGGTRLVQVLERSEDGLLIGFKAIDAGAGASCNTPTIGTPTQRSSDTAHGITVVCTVNADSEPMEVQIAVKATSYGTSAPANNDSGWVHAQTLKATTTIDILNLPSSMRVFVRARSLPNPKDIAGTPKLPSAWVNPSGTKYVDTAALTAPSSVTTTPSPILTTSTVTTSCTNADTAHVVEVILTTGGVDTLVKTLPPGSTGPVTLNAYLASSTTYTVSFRLRDELGGYSAKGTSSSFTTPASFTGPTLVAPTLTLLVG